MISLIKVPNKYTPVNNPVIFQIQSDNTNIQFFAVTITDSSANIIAKLRLFTTPDYRSGSFIDLSSILSNTVTYQLLPSPNLIDVTPDILQAYQLTIVEKLYSNGIIIDGVTLTSSLFYVWNGLLDKIQYTSYNYSQYVVTPTAINVNFLTNKPELVYLSDNTTEYLSFLNDGAAYSVQIKTYNPNALINTYNISLSGTSNVYRIDVSPASLTDTFNINFSAVTYFTVQVLDVNSIAKTKLKLYRYRTLCSYQDPVEIIFQNRLGAFDSCTFFNTRETVNVTRTNIVKNPFVMWIFR